MSKRVMHQMSLDSFVKRTRVTVRKPAQQLNFRDLPKGEEASVRFLQDRDLRPTVRNCRNGHQMKLYFGAEIFWKCNSKKCMQKIKIRVDNWFEETRLPFEKIICFMYSWAYEMTSIKWCGRELNIANYAAVDYNSFMRQICHEVLHRTSGIIGGPDMIVEVDESAYTHRKYQKGRLFPTTWVFGGICRGRSALYRVAQNCLKACFFDVLCRETRDVFLEVIEKRDAATLEEVIGRRIHPASIVISDLWNGYNGLERNELTLSHLTVNHKKNFVDPETGAHTNTVEKMWRASKHRNKMQNGTARHHLTAYLEEFWWRNRNNRKNPFDALMKDIAVLYPPNVPLHIAR